MLLKYFTLIFLKQDFRYEKTLKFLIIGIKSYYLTQKYSYLLNEMFVNVKYPCLVHVLKME